MVHCFGVGKPSEGNEEIEILQLVVRKGMTNYYGQSLWNLIVSQVFAFNRTERELNQIIILQQIIIFDN